MLIYNNKTKYFDYELEDVIKLFFTQNEIKKADEPWDECSGAFLFCFMSYEDGNDFFNISLKDKEFSEIISLPCTGIIDSPDKLKVKEFKRILKRKMFLLLTQYTGKVIPWGILTGIRPVKLVNELIDLKMAKSDILSVLHKDYFVTENKSRLLYEVAVNQRELFTESKGNSVSLYMGIPFCPTRCLYCSFSSSTIAQYKKMVDVYVDTLLKEIRHTAQLMRAKGLVVESMYIGGGTPTSLNERQLSRLLSGVEECIDMTYLREYTLEAGRPDTITIEKLKVIKNSRVSRISINPQTMNEKTLVRIGRLHKPEDVAKAFYAARDMGFDNINMDLICGLPGEDVQMFDETLSKIKKLNPDSLTVHTMAIKRASQLTREMDNYSLETQYVDSAVMVDMARACAIEMGLNPYYLYRQKNILGNLENVGYSRPHMECLYNIQIMEERQTILACGAGAVTKVIFPMNRIERSFNVKSVEEYIGRIDEMLERKANILMEENNKY
ncbi:coproporphyrinogen dehydrogenase HemZ [Clostridium sp. BNL1100]|uniref:coproporphyrinogen dehydrogenase HemZ n=1 Tax=Clostridium sp. BNL1100 TaxID=755731 RepID=UPI00024A75FA|nr:coproporphyrinogen dehydrogenase HemZ [Clostridium sp. BNL1100]AEY66467.1 coproporphyrinogen dehydrogenase HemZ [Clostridium sp. BNL1100]